MLIYLLFYFKPIQYLKYWMLEKPENMIAHGEWEKINGNFCLPQLFPRFGHTTVMYKNSLFVYGGLPSK